MPLKTEKILKKYNYGGRDRLIPLLQEIQNAEGYLSKKALLKIAKTLNLPTSKVYGVATFYNQFRFEPLGKYHIMVCRGTACHVKGSLSCLKMVENTLKIKAGQTTRDGLFSIETLACLGACGLAPVISINGKFHGSMTSEKSKKLIDEIKRKENENAAK